MRLTHLSTTPIERLVETAQGSRRTGLLKPCGFWYSCDNDWEEWCDGNWQSWLSDRKYRYELDLGDANILRITTEAEFEAFHREYVDAKPFGVRHRAGEIMCEYKPNWHRVAGLWDGIEIAPYQWRFRLDFQTMWYYGFDCSSGCLWRPRGASIKLTEPWCPSQTASDVLDECPPVV